MLIECSIYMTFINGKPAVENYRVLKRKILKDGINPVIIRNILREEIKARKTDPKEIRHLYKKLIKKLSNIKKSDPTIDKMVEDIIENEDNFENKLEKLMLYMYNDKAINRSIFGLKTMQEVRDKCVKVYNTNIQNGKPHREAALRALISIPVNLTTEMSSVKKIIYFGGILIALLLFGWLIAEQVAAKGILFLVPICLTLLSYTIARWLDSPVFMVYY